MSRKYRHSGYQDSDRNDRVRRKPPPQKKPLTPEEKAQRRGMRHAMDREANEVVRCPDCGRNVQSLGPIVPGTVCPGCNQALHCCRACRLFDTAARWECRADITERISDKMAANSCDRFQARLVLDATGKRSTARSPSDPKAMFDSLFKR